MASDERPGITSQRTRLPLAASRRRLSFEKRLRLWLYLLGLPALVLLVLWLAVITVI